MVEFGTREPSEHLAMRCQLHPQLGDATPQRDQLRKEIRVALEADQQSLVELIDALDDRFDRGVVVVSCHSRTRARNEGASSTPSSLPPEARSRKSSRKGTASVCEVTTQALPTRHTIETGSQSSGRTR